MDLTTLYVIYFQQLNWFPPRDSNPDMLLQRQLSYLPHSLQRRLRLSRVSSLFNMLNRSIRCVAPAYLHLKIQENRGQKFKMLPQKLPRWRPFLDRARPGATLAPFNELNLQQAASLLRFWLIGFRH
jgi:hypothetical protein